MGARAALSEIVGAGLLPLGFQAEDLGLSFGDAGGDEGVDLVGPRMAFADAVGALVPLRRPHTDAERGEPVFIAVGGAEVNRGRPLLVGLARSEDGRYRGHASVSASPGWPLRSGYARDVCTA